MLEDTLLLSRILKKVKNFLKKILLQKERALVYQLKTGMMLLEKRQNKTFLKIQL